MPQTATRADEDRPWLMGEGPPECSSSTALSVLPDCIYDVNGYYRELGVSPYAGRRDLRLAYQAAKGQESPRLTFIFKQLLNPEVRFAYDCMPMGEVFMDQYVADEMERLKQAMMSQYMQDLHDQGVDTSDLDTDSVERDIYAAMGIFDFESDTPDPAVDRGLPEGQDATRPAKFSYAYYLHRVYSPPEDSDLARLSEWQSLLASAMTREAIKTHFSVGFHNAGPHRWQYATVGYRRVFLLGHSQAPTAELADSAVRQFVRILDATPTTSLV